MKAVNYFGLGLALRLFVLLGLTIVFAYIFASGDWIFSQLVLLGLWILLAYETYRYVHYGNRKLSRFLSGIRYNELDGSFKDQYTDGGFKTLGQAMGNIVSEMRQFKSRHLEERTLLYSLLKSHHEGLSVCDDEGRIVFVNDLFCMGLGMKSLSHINQLKDDAGGPLIQIEDFKAGNQGVVDVRMDEEQDVRIEFENLIIDGRTFTFLRIRNKSNDVSSDAWLTMVNVVNHEIMNGISPIISLADSLESKTNGIDDLKLRLTYQNALKTIREQALGLTEFANDYRTFVKVPPPQKQRVNWGEVVQKVVETYEASFPKNLKWTFSGETSAVVYADPQQIKQVITNLMTNALHAVADLPQPIVHCRIEREKTDFVLTFSDNGVGVDKALVHQLFVPFFSTHEDGSGIGLPLCRRILENHGGTIRYLPRNDGWTRFRIVIPSN